MSEKSFNLQLLDERDNKLLGRKEMTFVATHGGAGSPSVSAVRKAVSEMREIPIEKIYVRGIHTEHGASRSIVEVNVYDNEQRASQIERKYVVQRNVKGEKET